MLDEEVRKDVRRTARTAARVTFWRVVGWFGIANVLAIIGSLLFCLYVLPQHAVHQADALIDEKVDKLVAEHKRMFLETAGAALISAGALSEQVSADQKQLEKDEKLIASLEERIKTLFAGPTAKFADAIEVLSSDDVANAVMKDLSEVHSSLALLQRDVQAKSQIVAGTAAHGSFISAPVDTRLDDWDALIAFRGLAAGQAPGTIDALKNIECNITPNVARNGWDIAAMFEAKNSTNHAYEQRKGEALYVLVRK